jgi:hypothetical protein
MRSGERNALGIAIPHNVLVRADKVTNEAVSPPVLALALENGFV